MYEITYSIDGIIRKIVVQGTSQMDAVNIFTNMYGSEKVQVISCIRKWGEIKGYRLDIKTFTKEMSETKYYNTKYYVIDWK